MREQRVYLVATAKSTFCDSLLRSRSVVLDWYVAGGVRMARKPLIAGNWKCFKTIAEGRRLARELRSGAANVSDVDIMVAPPFTALAAVAEELSGSGIGLAAQNVHWEPPGAWTGEIAAEQLLDVGCQYAIIGHSERRQFFGETSGTVNRRLRRCLETNLIPIVCTGETQDQRQAGRAKEVILGDLAGCLDGLTASQLSRMIIAYEPLWAIGTGLTATPEIAQQVHQWIRSWTASEYSSQLSGAVRILYGGSVKPDNASDLMGQEDIDGALIGGASLDSKTFLGIVQFESG